MLLDSFVSPCLSFHVNKCVCFSLCTDMYLYAQRFVSVLYLSLHVSLCVCVRLCTYICLYVYLFLFQDSDVCVSMCLYMCLCLCLHLYLSVFVSVSVSRCRRLCFHVSLYVFASVFAPYPCLWSRPSVCQGQRWRIGWAVAQETGGVRQRHFSGEIVFEPKFWQL